MRDVILFMVFCIILFSAGWISSNYIHYSKFEKRRNRLETTLDKIYDYGHNDKETAIITYHARKMIMECLKD